MYNLLDIMKCICYYMLNTLNYTEEELIMSYTSKRSLISMSVGILLLAAYAVYALGDASPAPDDLKSWAIALLVFVGACIAVGIVVQIVFHIMLAIGISAEEKDCDSKKVERIIKSSMLEDERDKLISLKSSNITYKFAGFGLVAGLIALAAGISTVIALHIMAGSYAFGSIIEGCMIIYLNERGVQNG